MCLLFVLWQSDHFWQRYNQFCIWPWKFKVKVMAKVKPDGHIWSREINRYVCFLFCGNRTIFGWDIANSTLKIQGQVHGQGQTRWSHLQPRAQSMCLLLVSWQSDHFWLRYSQFDIWPWKFKVKVTTKIDQNIISYSIGQGQQSCQKWKKSKKLFKSYRVDKNLRPPAAAAAYEPVQKHKVTPGIPGWLNYLSMLWLTLIHVSKRGLCFFGQYYGNNCAYEFPVCEIWSRMFHKFRHKDDIAAIIVMIISQIIIVTLIPYHIVRTSMCTLIVIVSKAEYNG